MGKRQGFTLLELLVVLAIVGILLGLLSVQMGGVLTASRQTQIETELETLLSAGEQFCLENPQEEAHGQVDLVAAGLLKEVVASPMVGYEYAVEAGHGRAQVSLEKDGQVYEQGAYRAEKISTRLYLD